MTLLIVACKQYTKVCCHWFRVNNLLFKKRNKNNWREISLPYTLHLRSWRWSL